MASDDPVDPRFKELLDQFERHIRNDADLDRLKAIRRQIRSGLPLSVRRYLPAYLLQEAVGAGVPRMAGGRGRPAAADRTPPRASSRSGRADRAAVAEPAAAAKPAVAKPAAAAESAAAKPAAAKPAAAKPAAATAAAPARESGPRDAEARDAGAAPEADGDMARLFVSVGRSRRVSRQMLTDLFVAKLELPHDHIGDVKVLDNFSFIEVPSEIAQTAIDKVSGETLNGRRVNVDYARSKKS